MNTKDTKGTIASVATRITRCLRMLYYVASAPLPALPALLCMSTQARLRTLCPLSLSPWTMFTSTHRTIEQLHVATVNKSVLVEQEETAERQGGERTIALALSNGCGCLVVIRLIQTTFIRPCKAMHRNTNNTPHQGPHTNTFAFSHTHTHTSTSTPTTIVLFSSPLSPHNIPDSFSDPNG